MTAWYIYHDTNTTTAIYLDPPSPTNMKGETVTATFKFNTVTEYEAVSKYLEYAGVASTGTLTDGTPWFREIHGRDNGLVMGFTPASPVPTKAGAWGVLMGGEELSRIPPADLTLELELFYLSRFEDHQDIGAVRAVYEK